MCPKILHVYRERQARYKKLPVESPNSTAIRYDNLPATPGWHLGRGD